jgi:hypothetical protein
MDIILQQIVSVNQARFVHMLNLVQGPSEPMLAQQVASNTAVGSSSNLLSDLSSAKTDSQIMLSETDQEEEEWSTLARLSSIIGTSSGDLSFGDSWMSGSSDSVLGMLIPRFCLPAFDAYA